MKFKVTAVSVNSDGDVLHRRVEEVDTTTNALYADCGGRWDVEDVYEAFWNRLNKSWEVALPHGKERVKVVKVEPVDDAAHYGLSRHQSAHHQVRNAFYKVKVIGGRQA